MLFAGTGRALVPTLRNPLISTSSLVVRLPPLGPRFGGVGLRLNVGSGCGSRLLIGVGRRIAWSADTSLSTRSVRSAIRTRRLCGISSWISLSPNRSFMRSSLKQARSVAYPALRRTSRSGFPRALLGFVARSRRFGCSSTSLSGAFGSSGTIVSLKTLDRWLRVLLRISLGRLTFGGPRALEL